MYWYVVFIEVFRIFGGRIFAYFAELSGAVFFTGLTYTCCNLVALSLLVVQAHLATVVLN